MKCLSKYKLKISYILGTLIDKIKSEENIKEKIKKISTDNGFIFKTPSAYKRRSVLLTPSTVGAPKYVSTPRKNLNLQDWLDDKGESVANYHYLKKFDEENKENCEINTFHNDSLEELKIKRNDQTATDYNPKEALEDLHKLILKVTIYLFYIAIIENNIL